jgi:uncharacterized protein (TIGR04255 family)
MLLPSVPEIQLNYANPPAVEVLFNIRAAVAGDFDAKLFLEPVKERFGDELSEHKEFKTFVGQFQFKGDGTAGHDLSGNMTGYRFNSADGRFLAHYLKQGLTLNFLPHYVGFSTAMEKLKDHWKLYSELVGGVPVTALSLRYIDRIDIPRDGDTLDLDRYFTIVPRIPDGLRAHSSYLQYWLDDGESDVRTKVVWSSIDDDRTDVWSFALDTETILDPADVSSTEDIWDAFDRMHDLCKHVFNDILTDKCKSLFQ